MAEQANTMVSINWADLIILLIVIFSMALSIIRGLARDSISLLSWCLAAWFAYKYGVTVGTYFTFIKTDIIRTVIGSSAIFLFVSIIGSLISHVISTLIRSSGVGMADRLMGAIFGFMRGIIIVLFAVMILKPTSIAEHQWWKDSNLIVLFNTVAEHVNKYIPEGWKLGLSEQISNLTLT